LQVTDHCCLTLQLFLEVFNHLQQLLPKQDTSFSHFCLGSFNLMGNEK
jgi:hypothetical protein